MRRALLILICLLPLTAFTQTPQLPAGSAAQKRYAQNHLRVQQTHPTASYYSKPYYQWTAFQGDRELTEKEFFAIAGRPDLSMERAQNIDRQLRKHEAASLYVGIGVIGTLGGVLWSQEVDADKRAPAYALSISGLVSTAYSIYKMTDDTMFPGVSMQRAVEAANDFNDRLMIALLLESQYAAPSPAPQPDEEAADPPTGMQND